jgi:hypothetical protein
MSSQQNRRPALSTALAFAFVLAACSSPTSPSIAPTAAALPSTGTANQFKHWPVQHPDGQYGHEDPNYPPEAWQCPRAYNIVYNGWNFMCVAPVCCDREFPRVEGYADSWKP